MVRDDRIRGAAFAVALAVVSAAVLWIYLTDPGIDGFFAARFPDMIHGHAFKPYVYRALLPWTVRVLVAALPSGVRHAISVVSDGSPAWAFVSHTVHVHPDYFVEFAVASSLFFGCFAAFGLAFRDVVRRAYDTTPVVADVAALAAVAAVPVMFSHGYSNYVYDPPTLFFGALALSLLVRERVVAFTVVYALALLNKETAVLLAVLFAYHERGRLPASRYFTLLGVMLVAFVLSRVLLNALYGENPGAFTMVHFFDHNVGLLRSFSLPSLLSALAFLVLVFGDWSRKPAILREAMGMAIPLVGSCLVFGFVDEMRDYYEVYPAAVALIVPSVCRLMRVSVVTRQEPREEPAPID